MEPIDQQVGGDHYRHLPIQPVVFLHANHIPFLEGSAIKYLCRHQAKGKAEDIRKAIHYCELILQLEYGEPQSATPSTTPFHGTSPTS